MAIEYEIKDRATFEQMIKDNKSVLIVKFGAEWCGPCKIAKPRIYDWFSMMPKSYRIVEVDIDVSTDVYLFLKSKRIVAGVPCIVAYHSTNKTVFPDEVVLGADKMQIDLFFERIQK